LEIAVTRYFTGQSPFLSSNINALKEIISLSIAISYVV